MIRFDPSGLKGAFDRMAKTAQTKGRDIATDQAKVFLAVTKTESWEEAPTVKELVAVAKKVGWRLKRKPGVTPAKELERRIRARGTFARKWHITNAETSGFKIRIWLKNDANYSKTVDDQRHVADRAAKKTQGKFTQKLKRLAGLATGAFK